MRTAKSTFCSAHVVVCFKALFGKSELLKLLIYIGCQDVL